MENPISEDKLKALKEKFETKPEVKKAIDKKIEDLKQTVNK